MKKYNLSEEDTLSWKEATKKFQKITHKVKHNQPYINKVFNFLGGRIAKPFEDDIKNQELSNLTINNFANINANYLKQIRGGTLEVDNILDLHHFTLDKAFDTFIDFILSSAHKKDRVVLVITGKGLEKKDNDDFGENEKYTGKIKNALSSWVNNYKVRKYILAFCLAHKKDGGEGAYYIFLKNIYKY